MNKRSLWYLALMMSTFVLLNTFVFDSTKKPVKEAESIADVSIEHLPISSLRDTDGQIICSSISLGDTFLTLSDKKLPTSLMKEGDTVHLIKRSNSGIGVYSEKISPTLESSSVLKDGASFIVLSGLSTAEPKVSAAVWEGGKATFLF